MRDTPKSVMLFGAGFGTRMRPLTDFQPKPLIQVAGRALLDHALEQVDVFHPEKTVLNAHYHTDQLKRHVSHRPDIEVIHESPDLLDTGGGLRNALPALGPGPVFTMNTDAVWVGANSLSQLANRWVPTDMDALLLLVTKDAAFGHKGEGDFSIAPDGRISRGGPLIYTGVQILRTDGLLTIPDRVFSLNLLWDSMMLDQRVYGIVHHGQWCDVGQPSSIAVAETMIANSDYV